MALFVSWMINVCVCVCTAAGWGTSTAGGLYPGRHALLVPVVGCQVYCEVVSIIIIVRDNVIVGTRSSISGMGSIVWIVRK